MANVKKPNPRRDRAQQSVKNSEAEAMAEEQQAQQILANAIAQVRGVLTNKLSGCLEEYMVIMKLPPQEALSASLNSILRLMNGMNPELQTQISEQIIKVFDERLDLLEKAAAENRPENAASKIAKAAQK